MKKRYLAVTLGIILSASTTMMACGTTSTSTASVSTTNAGTDAEDVMSSSSQDENAETVEGEVASVDGDTITVNIGTADSDNSSELNPTGETKEVTVTDDTTYEYQMGGTPSGDAPSGGGQAPGDSSDTSSDNGSSDSNSVDSTSGATDNSGSDNGQPPAMPGSNSSSDGSGSDSQPPEKPDSSNSSDNSSGSGSQPPAKPGSSDSGENGSSGSDGSSDSTEDVSGSSGSDEGEAPSGSAPSGDMPSGEAPSGMGEQQEASLDSLTEGTHVIITLADDGTAEKVTIVLSMGGMPGGGQGGQGGSDASGVTYSSENEISSDTTLSDQTIDSTGTDEEGILVDNGATATLKGLTVNRTSSDSTGGDNSSFYGVGASVLTTDGTAYLSDSTITSDAKGGAGVFSYGDGVTCVADTTISTSQDTSGGIHVAGGGKLYAWDVTATTEGESSAAIRSDRGGGTMVVDGGSYTSNGTGSPAIYSTADITVHDADLTANNSEAVCIEGLNSIRLFDCDLTGNMPDDNDQNDCTWNVILYQSMSGDSEVGNSTFEMVGGTLAAKDGGMFYTTNTESTFALNNVDITYADDNDFFLKCTGNSNARGWGSSGSNGADCDFTAIDQEMEGDIIWDSISRLDFYMTGSSSLKGAVTDDETNAGDGGDGYCNMYISSGSVWTVTGDSTLTSLYNAGTIVDEDGNTVTIVGADGTTCVEGTSEYTITVDNYSTDADLSGASSVDSWDDYSVEEPAELS